MICEKCGEENADRFKFCTRCGASLTVLQPEKPKRTEVSPEIVSENGVSRKPKQAELFTGQILDGKYRLSEVIETTGKGATYKAARLKTGDEVAVKIFNPENGIDSALADRFMRGAEIAAHFKHPNAVEIYDFNAPENRFFYVVTELIAGQSVRQIIKQQGILPPQTVSAIAAQVCDALDEAHRQGIVHRDIKPENIIVNAVPNNFRVKVLGFGLTEMNSLGTSDSPQSGEIAGTPHYMSPEQCLDEEIDGRSDIYSFGIVLYEMLSGAPPFNAPTATAIIASQITRQPPPLRSLNPNVPPPVEAAVMRSLKKQREARQQTAANLARELRTAVYIWGPHR